MVDWDEIVRREGPAVWRTIYRMVRNRADTDECLQEVFLTAVKSLARQHVRDWPAYLKRLAVSRAIDRIRQQVRTRGREEGGVVTEALASGTNPESQAENEELALALRDALAALPALHAEMFCLAELEDWSYQQLAEQFSMSTSAVGVQLHRTRKSLQELLSTTIESREEK